MFNENIKTNGICYNTGYVLEKYISDIFYQFLSNDELNSM
jgi:hypothetical protein